jgi:hypothetical protein
MQMRVTNGFGLLWRSLLLACLVLGTVGATAEGLSPKDEKQVLSVVRSQLDAFAQDDADKAFSYAAPNIRRLMGTAAHFMEMVRDRYEVVYRPASTTFLKPVGDATDAVLKVQLTEEDGTPWIAVYTLQKQKNKTWRITGCAVTPATGTMV